MNDSATLRPLPPSRSLAGVAIFVLLAIGGLCYVKWVPYVHRAFLAADTHSIGKSILMGTASAAPAPSLDAALDYAWAYGKAIWQAMVLGLLLGSAVQALLPAAWVARVLGRSGFGSVAAAGLLSLPGMMCTCCAAPVVAGLRSARAAPGAAIAFWLGNTMLNPATLVFMGFVLGWNWTALRLVFGLALVFGLGYALQRAAGAALPAPAAPLAPGQGAGSPFARWLRILARMSVRLLPEYLLLVLLLGAARAWLFPEAGPQVGNDIGWILAFALAGTLFVIPTAGEVPIVQAMRALGVAAGPAAALLVTLPPISLPSLAMLWRSFPPRVLLGVVAAVVAAGVLAGGAAVALGF